MAKIVHVRMPRNKSPSALKKKIAVWSLYESFSRKKMFFFSEKTSRAYVL